MISELLEGSATMSRDWMSEYGATLVERGWPILPLMPGQKWPARLMNGKWGGYVGWEKHCTRPTRTYELQIWQRWEGCGVGIACGSVVGVDIDVTDSELAGKIEALARDTLGETTLLRVGRAPKRLLVYRAAVPFKKMASKQWRMPGEAAGGKPHRVEILATGQQFVAYAMHPDTGEPYRWPIDGPDEIDLGRVPEVSEMQVNVFLTRMAGLVPASCFLDGDKPPQRAELYSNGGADPVGTPEAIADALAWLPNHDLHYDEWVRIGLAAKAGAGEAAFSAWDQWSSKSGKYDSGYTRKTWDGMKPNGSLGAGTIYDRAVSYGWVCPSEIIMRGSVAEAVETVGSDTAWIDRLIAKVQARAQIAYDDGERVDDTIDIVRGVCVADRQEAQEAEQKPSHEAGATDQGEDVKTGPESVTDRLVADAPGLIGDITRWMTGTAIFPQPFMALAAAMVCVATAAGRRYAGPYDIRTNTYVVAIANSGSGKENQLSCINNLFSAAGLVDHLAGEEVASGAAIEGAVTSRAVQLFLVDEFGHFMKSVMNPKAATSHRRDVFTKLTKYTGSANRFVRGTEYANSKERPRRDVHEPCVCLYGTTVPEPLWEAFGSGALSDGSVARMLYFLTPCNHPPRQEPTGSARDVPPAIATSMRAIVSQVAGDNDFAFSAARAQALDPLRKPGLLRVWPSPETERAIKAMAIEDDAQRLATEHSPFQAVYARWMEHVLRVSTLAAIARDQIAPKIELSDLAWARALVDHCIATLIGESQGRLADSEHEARIKRIVALIRKAGGEMKHNDLTRATQSMSRRERSEAIETLLESGQIVRISVSHGSAAGRPGSAYRIA